jgi:hypothetical protein
MSILIPSAAICGFIASEASSILPAIKTNENSPEKFSFRYYFTQPKNLAMLVCNAAGSTGLFLGHGELVSVMHKLPVLGEYFEGTTMPVITGLLIGFMGGRLIRWVGDKL